MIYSFGPIDNEMILAALSERESDSVRFSARDIGRKLGPGWWVAPNNQIYTLPANMSHNEWMYKNIELTGSPRDPKDFAEAFETAFKNGWVRIRIYFDEGKMSELIADVTAANISMLKTIPETAKDLLASCKALHFTDTELKNIDFYTKNEIESVLGRQRIASLNKRKTFSSRESVEVSDGSLRMIYYPSGYYEIFDGNRKIADGNYDNMISDSYNSQSKGKRKEELTEDLKHWRAKV